MNLTATTTATAAAAAVVGSFEEHCCEPPLNLPHLVHNLALHTPLPPHLTTLANRANVNIFELPLVLHVYSRVHR